MDVRRSVRSGARKVFSSRRKLVSFKSHVVLAAVFLCCFNQNVNAIVDIESLRERAGTVSGWATAGSLEASGSNGNSDKTDVSLSGLAQYLGDNFSNLIVFGSEYGESSGNKSADEQLLHLRHTRTLTVLTDWEYFYQWQQNDFIQLEERDLLGTGLRFKYGVNPNSGLYLGIGGFYESENRGVDGTSQIGRSNVYISYRKTNDKKITFVGTAYLQNKLDEFSDRRAVGGLSVSVPATDNFDFLISVDLEHDSRPPVGIEKTDWTYKTGIGWKF